MVLQSLHLTNFRNYSSANFAFSPQTTLVVGPNTAGKTNLLEAIYYLATGRSFRATHDREAIREGEVFARVEGIKGLNEGNDEEGLELTILANENGVNTSSKRFKVNGIKKRLSDFAGNLRAVYFGPEEILLVTGSPSRRRKYLDSVLCQVDREYARALLEYEKVLRQRNRLLLMLREKGIKGLKGVSEQLEYWDERLVGLGSVLSKKRGEMFNYFNERLGGKLVLGFLKSTRSWSPEKMPLMREREIAAGMTLWGPHRDDFCFMRMDADIDMVETPRRGVSTVGIANESESGGRDLAVYGSRGEQRLAVLHLKLAELEFITERTGPPRLGEVEAGERPILLLDDIFSELDEDNRGRVLELLDKQQTIVTATDLDQIDGEKLRQHKPACQQGRVLQLQ